MSRAVCASCGEVPALIGRSLLSTQLHPAAERRHAVSPRRWWPTCRAPFALHVGKFLLSLGVPCSLPNSIQPRSGAMLLAHGAGGLHVARRLRFMWGSSCSHWAFPALYPTPSSRGAAPCC